jgi:N-acetylglucosamine malate deacetylase 1
MVRAFLHKHKVHPRRWLLGLISYSRFVGYIRPALASGKSAEYRIWRKLLATAWEPRELVPPVGKRILAISPHSDDESIGAGGLLLAHRECAEIHIVVLTDGAAYGSTLGAENDVELARRRLVETRKQELLKTAQVLNAKSVEFLSFPDRGLGLSEEAVVKLRSVLESVRPDVVILPWFLDNHPDHKAANQLFAQACDRKGMLVLGYEIWAMSDPNAYFEITEQLEDKVSLVKNYESQLKDADYVTFAEGLARVRGYQLIRKTGRRAAEAFVALPAEDYCALVNEVL